MRTTKLSRRTVALVLGATVALYAGTIFLALHFLAVNRAVSLSDAALIAEGRNIFVDTPVYAPQHTGAKVSCSSCHEAGGFQPTAASMIDIVPRFPQWSARAGRVITLQDRVRECFVRSENGTPPDDKSRVMLAVVAYIHSVSAAPRDHREEIPKGLPKLASLDPNPVAGQAIYANHCAGCHGEHGEGKAPMFPPLWGPQSFNDGAGMHQVPKMASFVKWNMPHNRKGILTEQQAYDVAAYIHAQPRPAMNPAYAWY